MRQMSYIDRHMSRQNGRTLGSDAVDTTSVRSRSISVRSSEQSEATQSSATYVSPDQDFSHSRGTPWCTRCPVVSPELHVEIASPTRVLRRWPAPFTHRARLTHVETLLLLCTTYWGRHYLRSHGVYQIVRVLHETEKVDKVSTEQ